MIKIQNLVKSIQFVVNSLCNVSYLFVLELSLFAMYERIILKNKDNTPTKTPCQGTETNQKLRKFAGTQTAQSTKIVGIYLVLNSYSRLAL